MDTLMCKQKYITKNIKYHESRRSWLKNKTKFKKTNRKSTKTNSITTSCTGYTSYPQWGKATPTILQIKKKIII